MISIIIPVYNVERYLEECIISVVNQTFSDLEIILVDDGSKDNSPLICDNWAKKDSRIKVVHKNNGGLSSARNAGLDVATGDYIGFVDSDDIIDKDMYQNLFLAINNDKSIGMSSCMIKAFYDNYLQDSHDYKTSWKVSETRIIESSKFAELLLPTTRNFTVCSKLFKHNVIKDVRFEEGILNEDSVFIFELSKRVEEQNVSLVEIPFYGYYYRQRLNSICHSSEVPIEPSVYRNFTKMIDYYKDTNNLRMKDVISRYLALRSYKYLKKIIKGNHNWAKKYHREVNKFLKTISLSEIKRYKVSKKETIKILLAKLGFSCFKIITP